MDLGKQHKEYVSVVKNLQKMTVTANKAAKKVVGLDDKLQYQVLVKRLHEALKIVRLQDYVYHAAKELIQ